MQRPVIPTILEVIQQLEERRSLAGGHDVVDRELRQAVALLYAAIETLEDLEHLPAHGRPPPPRTEPDVAS